MQPNTVEVGRGVSWVSCGWRVFAKDAGTWIVLTLLLIVLFVALAFIPFGGFVLTLFAPAIAAGLLHGAAEIKAGRTLELAHLVQGFRQPGKFTPLIALGAVALAAGILSALIVAAVIGGRMMNMAGDPAFGHMAFGPGGLISLLLVLSVHLLVTVLLYFAVPLVMFQEVAPVAAMQSSARACLANIFPLFVFSLIYVVLAVIASIPFGLGWLVLLPWSAGMLYCSYEHIYPASPAAVGSRAS